MMKAQPFTRFALLNLALLAAPIAAGSWQSGGAPGRGAPLGVAPQDPAAMDLLQLHGGALLWAEVLGADNERVELRRLDQGGLVDLPWRMLAPTTERELRLRFGLIELEAEEIFTTAQRIPLTDGREVIGLIVERTDDALHVKTAGALMVLPMARIATGIANVQVSAREIFTRDELFEQRRAELAQALDAGGTRAVEAHEALALHAEHLFDYVRALEHWRAAEAGGLVRDDLAARLAQAERKAAVQEQVDTLDGIDRLRARGKFGEAFAQLETFGTRFPRSPLLEDRARLVSRVQIEQTRALERAVPQRWHYWSAALIREAARALPYEAALAWLDGQVSEDIAAKVALDMEEIAPGLQVADVRSLWERRGRGRSHSATYGIATWLLGADAARAGLPEPKTEGAPSAKDSQRAELEDRIQRYFKNQVQANRSSSGAQDAEDPAEVWATMDANARTQWMLAWYAENSGDMQLDRVAFAPCRTCGGTGVIEVYSTGNSVSPSGSRLHKCPLCRQVGVVRRVHYR